MSEDKNVAMELLNSEISNVKRRILTYQNEIGISTKHLERNEKELSVLEKAVDKLVFYRDLENKQTKKEN